MGIVAFDDLFPLKADPTPLDRVFGFDSGDGKSRGFTIQSILDLIADEPVTWAEITGKPSTFAPSAHSFGSHSNVASGIDSAPDGTFVKKVGGQFTAVAVDFYGVTNPPPPDPSVPDAVRGITATKIAQWDQAFGWGNHAGQYRPIAWVPSWAEVTGKPSTFAPATHTLGSHSDATALAAATAGQLIRKGATAFEVFTPDYYSPGNPPPPDASVPDFVRAFTIGQFAGYEEKLLEWAGLPDGAIPIIKGGVPKDSQILGVYNENPWDPSDPEYLDWVPELQHLVSALRIKAPDAVDADDLATLGQIPVLFDEDLEAIANAAPHSALNPFATMSDLFSKSIFDLLQNGATNGQAVVWSDANMRWEPGTVAGGGGADANAVHYNAADGKTASEKAQARENIGDSSGVPQIVSTGGFFQPLTKTSNFIIFNDPAPAIIALRSITVDEDGTEICIWNRSGINMSIDHEYAGSPGYIDLGGAGITLKIGQFILLRYNSTSQRWVSIDHALFLRKDVAQVHEGTFTQNGFFDVYGQPTGGTLAQPITRVRQASAAQVFAQYLNPSNVALASIDQTGIGRFDRVYVTGRMIAIGAVADYNAYCLSIRNWSTGAVLVRYQNTAGTVVGYVRDDGTVEHTRSNGADRSIRRDEQRLFYLVSVTTSGTISDQALTNGIFNYRFTAASDISGFANGEIGRVIDIDNASGSILTLLHENTGSIAANRIKLIGGADLVIPVDGKVSLKYCTGSRWELISKNF